MYYICPVCGYDRLEEPTYIDGRVPSHDICDCCGCEFGLDDCTERQIEKYRQKWVNGGCRWFVPEMKPENWNFDVQLKNLH